MGDLPRDIAELGVHPLRRPPGVRAAPTIATAAWAANAAPTRSASSSKAAPVDQRDPGVVAAVDGLDGEAADRLERLLGRLRGEQCARHLGEGHRQLDVAVPALGPPSATDVLYSRSGDARPALRPPGEHGDRLGGRVSAALGQLGDVADEEPRRPSPPTARATGPAPARRTATVPAPAGGRPRGCRRSRAPRAAAPPRTRRALGHGQTSRRSWRGRSARSRDRGSRPGRRTAPVPRRPRCWRSRSGRTVR